MRKIIAILTVMIMVCCCSFALADDDATISVTATSTIVTVPDMATLNIGASTACPTVKEAQTKNAETMDKVIAEIVATGVKREDISTTNFSVSPVYDYSGDTPALTGYSVDNTLLVIIRELSSVSSVIDAAMSAGANSIYGISFLSSKEGEAYDEALTKAIAEARRKAELIASASGMKLGAAEKITETNANSYMPVYRSTASLADNATPIEHGTLQVTATVTIEFEAR